MKNKIPTDEEAQQKLKDPNWRINHLYKIKTKDARLAQFKLNPMQQNYAAVETYRDMTLKARQLGFSTYKLIKQLDYAITNENVNCAVVAHKLDKVQTLFEIIRLAYQHLPEDVPGIKPRVSYDNRNELYFPELNSKIYVATDTRSETIHNLHISEVAFIQGAEQKLVGILESVPKTGIISMESTANGTSGYFYNEWENERSEFRKFFFNWTWDTSYVEHTDRTLQELNEEYQPLAVKYGLIKDLTERFEITPQQFRWYINKVDRLKQKVMQEYPTTALEAFISAGRNVFHLTDIQHHIPLPAVDRKWGDLLIWEKPIIGFMYVIGCDPSEGAGGDNAVISVWNAFTGEQAAEFASNHCPPDTLGDILIQIGNYYNKGFIVLEINNHGLATLNRIKEKYYNIYRREVFDTVTKETVRKLGWKTTGTTKPLMVMDFEIAAREMSMLVRSEELLKEMKVFVQTDEVGHQGYGAEGSNKDDRVIAACLARQGIKHLPKMKMPKTEAQKKLEAFIKSRQLANTPVEVPARYRNVQRGWIRR